jgi:hypothetical protein
MSDKRAKAPVARNQERAMIQAGLHNERISQFRFVTQPDHAGAQVSPREPNSLSSAQEAEFAEKNCVASKGGTGSLSSSARTTGDIAKNRPANPSSIRSASGSAALAKYAIHEFVSAQSNSAILPQFLEVEGKLHLPAQPTQTVKGFTSGYGLKIFARDCNRGGGSSRRRKGVSHRCHR